MIRVYYKGLFEEDYMDFPKEYKDRAEVFIKAMKKAHYEVEVKEIKV